MRKKSGFTIVEQAIMLVPEFENVVRKLEQQVTLRGQSKSTLNNYIRRIALFVINFKSLPENIALEEINEYLVALARDPKSPSRSSFKHTVKRNKALRFTSEKQSSNKPNEKSLPPETKQQRFQRLTGVNLSLCPQCKTGRMITVRELPRTRSPGCYFLSFQHNQS
jgi:hypothetical protein